MVMQFIKIFRKLFEIIGSLVEPCKIGIGVSTCPGTLLKTIDCMSVL